MFGSSNAGRSRRGGVGCRARLFGAGRVVLVALVVGGVFGGGASAWAVTPRAAWSIDSVAEPTNFSAADVQDMAHKLTVTATEGTYELHLGGGSVSHVAEATPPIAWDASAAQVAQALETLVEAGPGGVMVTGGPGDASGSASYTITWGGGVSGLYPGFLETVNSTLMNGAGAGSAVSETVKENEAHDRFGVEAINVGSRPTEGTVTVADKLPPGLVPVEISVEEPAARRVGECSLAELKCTYEGSVLPGRELVVEVEVAVPSPTFAGPLVNAASVSGGGGGEASVSASNPVNVGPASFGLTAFGVGVHGLDGALDAQAGEHPYSMTATSEFNTALEGLGRSQVSNVVRDVKDVEVELPLGFAGDALAAERCPAVDLSDTEGTSETPGFHTACPPGSQVGTISLALGEGRHPFPLPVYNVVPERGYPAELGFNPGVHLPSFAYASVVHGPAGYRLRIGTPGIIRAYGTEPSGIRLMAFGDPGAVNGTGSDAAFLRNPTDCAAGPLNARLDVTSWEGDEATGEATAYPEVTGCDLLQGAAGFDPTVAVAPETTQADTPSGYVVDVKVPQAPSVFGALATPDLKDATITLPAGMSISPSAASGPSALAGCAASGGEGINLGSGDVAASGEDLGDPEATELGAGHPGGDGSPYDDGLWHSAPGHCPGASRIAEVEARTPVLSEALHGHLYLAQPACGGAGQGACTEQGAEEGKVFGVYLEVAGSGVVVKQPGMIEVGGYGAHSVASGLAPGQVRVRFAEAPQSPLEEVKVTFPGGPRAVVANPQSCGTATTVGVLEPWSAPESGPNATSSSSFVVGGCPGVLPFSPGFSAGTVTPLAGGFSPFVLQLTRQDGEQDLAGLSATLPEGLLAKLAGVAQCPAPEAAAGTCSSASQIGTVTATAGAGSQPLVETGRVYLTGPYNGGPFGEVAVVPAVAGPFNLGNIVVRGSIRIDPHTARASIVSDPLPTSVDGVPVRLRSVDVEVNRPEFTFNPTSCEQLQVTGTLTADQPDGTPGASVSVASPFAATGCKTLPFHPVFTPSTQAKTSKHDGASLTVKGVFPAGEANIHSVAVVLPKQLPARLTTIQQACTEAQFAANPATCPAGSMIGTATASTPILAGPVTGPVYLVSHGGAAFPDVVAILQGEGVTVELTGSVNIKHGITSSDFATVPDAPISSFTLTLPEGPHSGLAAVLPAKAKGNMCATSLTMPFTIAGQNGAQLKQNLKIHVTGCPKPKKKAKPKARKKGKGKK